MASRTGGLVLIVGGDLERNLVVFEGGTAVEADTSHAGTVNVAPFDFLDVVLLEMLNGAINMNPVMFRLLFN